MGNATVPIIVLLVGSFFSHQVIVFLGSISLPVRNLLSHCLCILHMQTELYYINQMTIMPIKRENGGGKPFVTLAAIKGSLCSWSRYFSMLNKVSKNIWESLHLFKSLRVIFPEETLERFVRGAGRKLYQVQKVTTPHASKSANRFKMYSRFECFYKTSYQMIYCMG